MVARNRLQNKRVNELLPVKNDHVFSRLFGAIYRSWQRTHRIKGILPAEKVAVPRDTVTLYGESSLASKALYQLLSNMP